MDLIEQILIVTLFICGIFMIIVGISSFVVYGATVEYVVIEFIGVIALATAFMAILDSLSSH